VCPTSNLVRMFSFGFPFLSPCLFLLNNNPVSKHGGRVVLCFLFLFLVCILVRACSFRFPFVFNDVLHFRFAYRITWSGGVDWFEMLSNDAFARHDGLPDLDGLLMSDPFAVKICEGFVKISYFNPCVD